MTSNQCKGFTLVEVLVALVIIAISLTAAMKTTGDITNSSFYLKQKVFAHWVAQNRLAELELLGKWPSREGVKKDTTEFANQEWQWIQTTTKTAHKDIYKIEIGVKLSDSDPDDDPIITLASYSLNPQLVGTQSLVLMYGGVDSNGNPISGVGSSSGAGSIRGGSTRGGSSGGDIYDQDNPPPPNEPGVERFTRPPGR